MTEFTLLTKAFTSNQVEQVETLVKKTLEGLTVDTKVSVVSAHRWIQLALSGDDERVARNLISKEIGFCPATLQNIKRFSVLGGYIMKLGKSPDELYIDVGVFQPETVFAIVPLHQLQARLADGRKLALKKIAELFGFCENLPISVKVTEVNKAENRIEAELAFKQLERFSTWQESLLDRLIVLGSPIHEVKKMLKHTGLERDVIHIEPLGVFDYALTCKLGTDAAGLISQAGRNLRNATFIVFNPRKIWDLLHSPSS
jgi:hypothetical protein